jgi:hypothetical protein
MDICYYIIQQLVTLEWRLEDFMEHLLPVVQFVQLDAINR